MFTLGERVCPSCQVVLPPGARTCRKCGNLVEPEKTHIKPIDWVQKLHPSLVHYLGPVSGNVVAGLLIIVFCLLLVGLHLLVKWLLA